MQHQPCMTLVVATVWTLVPSIAPAQTPLLDRYESYFSTPFESTPELALRMDADGRLPAFFVRSIVGRVLARKRWDRLRIQRSLEGVSLPTGFEDVDGDGVVSMADLEGLNAYLFAKLRALAPGLSDEEIGLPSGVEAPPADPQRHAAALAAYEAKARFCIELGCDGDGDGVDDLEDLCPGEPDPMQGDRDGDGFGDACDRDSNNNAVPDALEDCRSRSVDGAVCLEVLEEIRRALRTAREESVAAGTRPPAQVLHSLEVKIDHAEEHIRAGDDRPAAGVLGAFANQARAMSGKAFRANLGEWMAVLADNLAAGLG